MAIDARPTDHSRLALAIVIMSGSSLPGSKHPVQTVLQFCLLNPIARPVKI